MHVRLTGDSKLSVGVSVSVNGCLSRLSLCGPVMDWRPVQGYPASPPRTAGIGSSPTATRPTDLAGIENGWMDGWMDNTSALTQEYSSRLILTTCARSMNQS